MTKLYFDETDVIPRQAGLPTRQKGRSTEAGQELVLARGTTTGKPASHRPRRGGRGGRCFLCSLWRCRARLLVIVVEKRPAGEQKESRTRKRSNEMNK